VVTEWSKSDVVGALARSTICRGWPREVLEDISTHFRRLAVEPGVVCCLEGAPGHEMFIVDEGRFHVTAMVAGRQTPLAELGPGAVFGEMAIVTGKPRSATVTAATAGVVWALRRDDFHALIAHYPELKASVDRLVNERLGRPFGVPVANEKTTLRDLPKFESVLTIGRSSDNGLVLDLPVVSRHHAVIQRIGDHYEIVDLNSTNGTFVNGVRIEQHRLVDGDEILIGSKPMYFDRSSLKHFSRGGGIKIDALNLNKVVGKDVRIVNNLSMSIYPGELVCIVGVSGAGKTTLLDSLNGFRPATSGQVLYNGLDYYEHFDAYRLSLGYVPQDDIVHRELTVHQTLYYAARLRLPPDTSRGEIQRLIDEVLDALALTERRNIEVRRLSGGQRKRVSIGVELLSKPDVFFLDEPTSGLDPGLDGRMMELLRSLADQGRTVILTTHATKNVMICDKVAFLAKGGRLAFFGAPADALTYFDVTDFTDIYKQLEYDETPEAWEAKFRGSVLYQRNIVQRLETGDARLQPTTTPEAPKAVGVKRSRANPFLQLFWLIRRYFQILLGDKVSLAILLAAAPIIAVTTTQTFTRDVFELNIADGGDAYEAIAVMLMLATTSIFLGAFIAARAIAEEIPVYTRERLINLGLVPYVISKLLTLGVFSLVQSALLAGILSIFIVFPGEERTLLEIFGIMLLTNLVAVSLGLMISAASGNGLQATLILVVVFIPQLMLAGGIQPLSRVTTGAKVMAYGLVSRWSLSLLGHAVDLNARIDAQLPKNDFRDQFDIDPTQYTLILAGLGLVFLIGAIIALKVKDTR
jgi:ABC-type multidrug transport system ATPase subunit